MVGFLEKIINLEYQVLSPVRKINELCKVPFRGFRGVLLFGVDSVFNLSNEKRH